MNETKRKVGRHPKKDPAVFRYTVRFNAEEHIRFLAMFDKAGAATRSVFIKQQFFGQPFRVFVEDRSLLEYYQKLSSFHSQYRAVGNNYNQIVKELRVHFSEKKAMALLYKLEKCTQELIRITQGIIRLTQEFERKWSLR